MKPLSMFHKKLILAGSTVAVAALMAVYAVLNRTIFNTTFDTVFFIVICLCATAVFAAAFYLLFFKQWPLHRLFIVVGSAVGILSMIVNAPGSIPDEEAHIKNAYLWSNRISGIHDTVSDEQTSGVYIHYASSIRKADLWVLGDVLDNDTSAQTYSALSKDFRFFVSADGAELVPCEFQDNSISPVAYFPAILGITLARLFHLGTVPLLYLGRLFMLAFYIFGISWAIKRIPFGKLALFIIAIMPMCVHLAPSFSYDTVIIALASMLLAQIFQLAYGDTQRIGRNEWIVSCLLVFLFIPLKIMIYLPVVLLFFLIPASKFGSRRSRYIFCFSMLLLGVASIIVSNLSVVLSYSPGNTLTNQSVTADHPAYTAAWMWQHPLDTLSILFNTTIEKGIYYYTTMIGGLLGWLDVPVAHWILHGFALCLIAACFSEKTPQTALMKPRHRLLFLLPPLFTYVFVLLGMMIWWTPAGTSVILGVQGRYFIPVLPLLVFSVYGFRRVPSESFGRSIAMVSIALTLLAFPNMLVTVLAR